MVSRGDNYHNPIYIYLRSTSRIRTLSLVHNTNLSIEHHTESMQLDFGFGSHKCRRTDSKSQYLTDLRITDFNHILPIGWISFKKSSSKSLQSYIVTSSMAVRSTQSLRTAMVTIDCVENTFCNWTNLMSQLPGHSQEL